MVHVIASIQVAEGKIAEVMKMYETFTPLVNEEKGCVRHLPTVDFDTEIPIQQKESGIITVIEQWDNIEDYYAHLSAPHVIEFRENITELVEKVSIKVLQSALI